MFFKQRVNEDASISYFFGCGGHGKAAVDVLAGDELWFLEQARQLNVSISHVIDTHIHADLGWTTLGRTGRRCLCPA